MALSNQTDFKLNRNEIITLALKDIGVIEGSETPTSQEISDASEILNLMIKSWVADSLQLWIIKTATVNLENEKIVYTVGPARDVDIAKPHKIYDIVFVNNEGSENSMELLSRSEYWELTNKNSFGESTIAYYSPLYEYGELYLWPVVESVTNESIKFSYPKVFDDLDNATDDFEIPSFALNAVRWNLALELTPGYNIDEERYRRIVRMADKSYQKVLDYDTENASLFLMPRDR